MIFQCRLNKVKENVVQANKLSSYCLARPSQLLCRLSGAGSCSCAAASKLTLKKTRLITRWGGNVITHHGLKSDSSCLLVKFVTGVPSPVVAVLCRCKGSAGQDEEDAREHEEEIQLRPLYNRHAPGGSAAGCRGGNTLMLMSHGYFT